MQTNKQDDLKLAEDVSTVQFCKHKIEVGEIRVTPDFG